ncbi:MAG: hypothetical protein CME65_02650 [Halobacteriovoraceae bacterium]|nr:hypothetical protein [Halobacteriovoraceae bacterium]|tara:strand:- start:7033 stop:7455 length:423 start_codon:yes stop_codon:yes gene_type:complete
MKFLIIFLLSFNLYAIEISNERVRLLPPGSPTTALFMDIENPSNKDIYLLKAESNISRKVELHNHIIKDGMMKMEEVSKIKISAKSKTQLKPGGLHIMMIGLKNNLKEGQEVEVKLSFDDGKTTTIKPKVVKFKAHHHKR